jgi:hypothetical protein
MSGLHTQLDAPHHYVDILTKKSNLKKRQWAEGRKIQGYALVD